jgi:hypothetical protein
LPDFGGGAIPRNAVLVTRRLEVELVLRDDDFVLGLALVELVQQELQVVVADRGRARFAAEHRRQAGRAGAPEGDLLQADEVGLLFEDLVGQALGPGREVVGADFAQDLAGRGDEGFEAGRADRRGQVGSEVEVAGHRADDLAAAVTRAAGMTGEAGVPMTRMAVARVPVARVPAPRAMAGGAASVRARQHRQQEQGKGYEYRDRQGRSQTVRGGAQDRSSSSSAIPSHEIDLVEAPPQPGNATPGVPGLPTAATTIGRDLRPPKQSAILALRFLRLI